MWLKCWKWALMFIIKLGRNTILYLNLIIPIKGFLLRKRNFWLGVNSLTTKILGIKALEGIASYRYWLVFKNYRMRRRSISLNCCQKVILMRNNLRLIPISSSTIGSLLFTMYWEKWRRFLRLWYRWFSILKLIEEVALICHILCNSINCWNSFWLYFICYSGKSHHKRWLYLLWRYLGLHGQPHAVAEGVFRQASGQLWRGKRVASVLEDMQEAMGTHQVFRDQLHNLYSPVTEPFLIKLSQLSESWYEHKIQI